MKNKIKKIRKKNKNKTQSSFLHINPQSNPEQRRKEQNLPSNMVFEVYQTISEVLQRKQSQGTNTTPQQHHQRFKEQKLPSSIFFFLGWIGIDTKK